MRHALRVICSQVFRDCKYGEWMDFESLNNESEDIAKSLEK